MRGHNHLVFAPPETVTVCAGFFALRSQHCFCAGTLLPEGSVAGRAPHTGPLSLLHSHQHPHLCHTPLQDIWWETGIPWHRHGYAVTYHVYDTLKYIKIEIQ